MINNTNLWNDYCEVIAMFHGKDFNTMKTLVKGHNATDDYFDLNYKSICVTINRDADNKCSIGNSIEYYNDSTNEFTLIKVNCENVQDNNEYCESKFTTILKGNLSCNMFHDEFIKAINKQLKASYAYNKSIGLNGLLDYRCFSWYNDGKMQDADIEAVSAEELWEQIWCQCITQMAASNSGETFVDIELYYNMPTSATLNDNGILIKCDANGTSFETYGGVGAIK